MNWGVSKKSFTSRRNGLRPCCASTADLRLMLGIESKRISTFHQTEAQRFEMSSIPEVETEENFGELCQGMMASDEKSSVLCFHPLLLQ